MSEGVKKQCQARQYDCQIFPNTIATRARDDTGLRALASLRPTPGRASRGRPDGLGRIDLAGEDVAPNRLLPTSRDFCDQDIAVGGEGAASAASSPAGDHSIPSFACHFDKLSERSWGNSR
jgi:hypothetical protein